MPSSSDDVATSAGSVAALQQVLDLDALLARDRPVVRPDERLAGQLVQRAGQPLREPPAVHEDQRRAVRANQLQKTRVNRRPDGWPRVADRDGPAGDFVRGCQPCHILDRHLNAERQRLLLAGIDDGHRPVRNGPMKLKPADRDRPPSIGGQWSVIDDQLVTGVSDVFFWSFDHRPPTPTADCRLLKRDSRLLTVVGPPNSCNLVAGALWQITQSVEVDGGERRQSLEREHEVDAALGRHQGVDLVDDDGFDRAEGLAGVRGQRKIMATRRRNRGCRKVRAGNGPGRQLACRPVRTAMAGDMDIARWPPPGRSPPAARRLRSTSTARALSGETYSTRHRRLLGRALARSSAGRGTTGMR